MNTAQTETASVIARLEAHIASECTVIDREEAFNDMLDEIYSFEKVGGPFANMSPSRVLLEVDPVAHRCGVNDYADGEAWVEVDGETYAQDDAEKAKQEFLDELETEAGEIEERLDDLCNSDGPVEDGAEIKDLEADLAAKQAEIAAVEKHSF